ncbi:MAG: cob(I)yrinic acid a,c-diamide adenosyltransferase [Candidatus Peribacteraceae bacterium]
MPVTTRTGDDGTTGLLDGTRTGKESPHIHAAGEVDELNAVLGIVLAEKLTNELAAQLRCIQQALFVLGADIASGNAKTDVRVQQADIERLEHWTAQWEKSLPPLERFILPRGCRAACVLHQARTVCRRAERWIIAAGKERPVSTHAQVYVNRLSDFLFLAARATNHAEDIGDTPWIPDR